MDSLRIDTGLKRVAINDDPDRVIEFNPSDVVFAERFEAAYRDFNVKSAELECKAKALDENKAEDNQGLSVNMPEQIAFLRETCEYMRGKVDEVFGEGTSKKAFGDTLNLDMFAQFFTGILPFVQPARSEKIAPYLPKGPVNRKKHPKK